MSFDHFRVKIFILKIVISSKMHNSHKNVISRNQHSNHSLTMYVMLFCNKNKEIVYFYSLISGTTVRICFILFHLLFIFDSYRIPEILAFAA